MRSLVIFLGLLITATPAFALDESIIQYCFTTANPQSCLHAFNDEAQRSQREMQQRQIDAQLEQARIQAQGMALFGAGNALINGMNQNLQNMQQPYLNTPQFSYDKQPRR